MNIRCAFCQTPYTLSRVEMLDALQEMDAHKLTHYDAHCPRCRRATQLPRQRMEMFMPKWRDELKEYEAEMKEHPQQEAAPAAEAKPEPEPKAVKEKPATRAKASTAKSSSKEKKPADSKSKTTTKKSK
jgi:hypothetical protein